jgi:integrase
LLARSSALGALIPDTPDTQRARTRALSEESANRASSPPAARPEPAREQVEESFAIRALRAGASPVAAQKLLGHASLSTTSRYLDHLELGELREAVPELPGSDSGD